MPRRAATMRRLEMYQQVYDPVAHSLGVSSNFAALALLVLFVLLGGVRMKAHWAALVALGVSLVVATVVYSMPVGQALDSAAEGAAFGFYPIMWIVINAIWIYNMTRETGHFEILGRSFSSVSVPIITLGQVSSLPVHDLGSMVGRQTPILALFVPLALVFMIDGRRGVRQVWPAAMTCGLAFALAQFVASNYISVQLTDIFAALFSAGAVMLLLRVWRPVEPLAGAGQEPPRFGRPAVAGGSADDPAFVERQRARVVRRDPPGEGLRAYLPYVIIIVVFSL